MPIAKSDLFCLPDHIESYGAQVFGRLARERHLTDLGAVGDPGAEQLGDVVGQDRLGSSQASSPVSRVAPGGPSCSPTVWKESPMRSPRLVTRQPVTSTPTVLCDADVHAARSVVHVYSRLRQPYAGTGRPGGASSSSSGTPRDCS